MAHHIVLKAVAVRRIEPAANYGVQVALDMTFDQKLDAVEAITGTFTPDQWDALKDRLDKEFAT